MRATILTSAFALTLAFGAASTASGQTPNGSDQAGPLVLTRISNAIVFAPDVKVTAVNGNTAVLTGAYVGTLLEKTVLMGGGAYWLVDPLDNAHMFYMGFVFGWRVYGSDRISIGAHGLLGGGTATLYDSVSDYHYGPGHHPGGYARVGYYDGFLVAEPEVRVHMALTNAVDLNLGAGYRVTSADYGFYDQLRGATASFGVRFNIGH